MEHLHLSDGVSVKVSSDGRRELLELFSLTDNSRYLVERRLLA